MRKVGFLRETPSATARELPVTGVDGSWRSGQWEKVTWKVAQCCCCASTSSHRVARTRTSICFIRVLHTALKLKQPISSYLAMESNSRSVTDMDDQPHCVEISVDFIKKRPTSDLELVFKDDASATRESNKFTNGARVRWNVNIYLKTHTSATLTIQRLGGLFNSRVAEVSVEFKPYKFGDDKVVRLEGGDVLFPVQSTSC
ncbi:hypothetical protein EDB85DRAFT_1890100 [Lactarius pseudohatsudake]|nr:hypothetical protein EDB85DRAFT_1890100 [Lactarius pseudohatsudake]